ncbi:unnamed protein product, partial [Polarella glacialis]
TSSVQASHVAATFGGATSATATASASAEEATAAVRGSNEPNLPPAAVHAAVARPVSVGRQCPVTSTGSTAVVVNTGHSRATVQTAIAVFTNSAPTSSPLLASQMSPNAGSRPSRMVSAPCPSHPSRSPQPATIFTPAAGNSHLQ